MKFILDYKSPNYDLRNNNYKIKYIIIHYTAIIGDMNALKHLSLRKNKVSSHFFINKLGQIFNLVNTNYRAWHAGISRWKNVYDLNSTSIGIEIDNSGHHLKFENYTDNQIKSLSILLIDLKKKFRINKKNILGHSDIAPYRKIDPGEKFPWVKLSNKNIVFFPRKIRKKTSLSIDFYLEKLKLKSKKNCTLYMLGQIGYDINPALNNKKKYHLLIKAYQMHYYNSNVSGLLDKETYEIIKSHFKQLLTWN